MSDTMPCRPTSGLSSRSGQARTQFPQRAHKPMNLASDMAPGGRSGLARSASDRRNATFAPTAPTATASTDRRGIPRLRSKTKPASACPARRRRNRILANRSCVAPSGQTFRHHARGHAAVRATMNNATAATSTPAAHESRHGKPTTLPNTASGSVQSSRG